jgi:hypothetical protein
MVQGLAAGRDSGLKDSPGSPYQGEAVRSVLIIGKKENYESNLPRMPESI